MLLTINEQLLIESPQLVNPTNFSLDDDELNIAWGIELHKRIKETFYQKGDDIFYMTGDGTKGYLVLQSTKDMYIDYLVRYEVKKVDGLGKFCMQTVLWVSDSPRTMGMENNISSKGFFDILLKKYHRIISDKEQTKDGQRFWRKRMSIANQMQLKVGYIQVGLNKIDWFDPSGGQLISQWMDDRADAWTSESKGRYKRFVVSDGTLD